MRGGRDARAVVRAPPPRDRPASWRSPRTRPRSCSPRSSRAVDPDAIQFNGASRSIAVVASPAIAWKALHLPRRRPDAADDGGRIARRPRAPRRGRRARSSSTPRAARIPAAPGPRRPPTARRRGRPRGAGHPGRRPEPGQRRATPLRDIPAVGVDVALGRRAAARSPGERPRKDPFKVALFVKRARAARDDRPNLAPSDRRRSTPACSRPTRPGAGAWSATSAADTCPRPSWRRSSSSRPRMTRCATTRSSGRTSASCSPDTPGGRRPLYRADRLAEATRAEAIAGSGPAGPVPRAPPLPQARGPRPHRRPQDQQRARPGAAHPAARQDRG